MEPAPYLRLDIDDARTICGELPRFNKDGPDCAAILVEYRVAMRDRRDFDSYVAGVAENIRRYDGHAVFEHRSYGFSQRVSYLTHAVKGTKPHRRFWDKPEPDLFERLPKQAHEAMSVLERCPLSSVGMCWGTAEPTTYCGVQGKRPKDYSTAASMPHMAPPTSC